MTSIHIANMFFYSGTSRNMNKKDEQGQGKARLVTTLQRTKATKGTTSNWASSSSATWTATAGAKWSWRGAEGSAIVPRVRSAIVEGACPSRTANSFHPDVLGECVVPSVLVLLIGCTVLFFLILVLLISFLERRCSWSDSGTAQHPRRLCDANDQFFKMLAFRLNLLFSLSLRLSPTGKRYHFYVQLSFNFSNKSTGY